MCSWKEGDEGDGVKGKVQMKGRDQWIFERSVEFLVYFLQPQYEFCYKSVLEFLDSFDAYSNFK